MDIEIFQPLGETDTKQDFAQRFNNYLDLPRDILAEAERQELCKTKRITKTAYGFDFHNKDVASGAYAGQYAVFDSVKMWIGLDTRLWALYGKSPIWCLLEPCPDVARRSLQPWLRSGRAYEDGPNRISIPIPLKMNVDKGDVVQGAVKQIRELRSMLSE